MSLVNNIHLMSNKELNGLAQNRFIDEEIQTKLAKSSYRLCLQYLAQNRSLCTEARDILWNRRGYVLKSLLISSGSYIEEPKKYHELYRIMKDRRSTVSQWRVQSTFVYSYWSAKDGPGSTPKKIVEDLVINNPFMFSPYVQENLAKHPGLTSKAAVVLTTSKSERVAKLAFKRLAGDLRL